MLGAGGGNVIVHKFLFHCTVEKRKTGGMTIPAEGCISLDSDSGNSELWSLGENSLVEGPAWPGPSSQ